MLNKNTIFQKLKQVIWLSALTFILSLVAGTTLYVFAAFTEPAAAPSASDQDFTKNILGANNADNDFDSSSVAANTDGSIIERLESIENEYFNGGYPRDFPGAGFASTSLTEAACESASDWEWFEDGGGNGLTGDPEDGVCVKTTTRIPDNWGGTEANDNTYIMDYDCTGTFPNGTTTVAAANSCALCVADCYDGVKNLPDQGSYTSPDTSCSSNEDCYEGPITPEVLKSWKGTRLPTSQDFFGFCGYKDGGSDYETGCSSDITDGDYGVMMGRTDECIDLSDSGTYEWLSEQHGYNVARMAGSNACSFVTSDSVIYGYRFRAVFRP